MASELDIDAIEQRANAATKPPWIMALGYVGGNHEWFLVRPDCDGIRAWTDQDHIDFDFAAHARQDIPALVKRVRELEAIIVRNCTDRCDVSDHVSIERRNNGYVVYVDGFNGADRITYFPDVLDAIDAATLAEKGLADGK